MKGLETLWRTVEKVKERTWLKIDTKSEAPKKATIAVFSYMGPGMNEVKLKEKDKSKDKEKEKDKEKDK